MEHIRWLGLASYTKIMFEVSPSHWMDGRYVEIIAWHGWLKSRGSHSPIRRYLPGFVLSQFMTIHIVAWSTMMDSIFWDSLSKIPASLHITILSSLANFDCFSFNFNFFNFNFGHPKEFLFYVEPAQIWLTLEPTIRVRTSWIWYEGQLPY